MKWLITFLELIQNFLEVGGGGGTLWCFAIQKAYSGGSFIFIYLFISERASISSVQWKSTIYLYVCMYSFFYGMFMHASTNEYLDSATNCTFHAGGSNAANSSIAHTPWKKRNQIKEKVGTGERSQTE